ncbi:MAG: alpha-L-fucosidase [Opitutales bacterium]|nr:alpha-L-fucosidase [Opitutales bacterium]
MKKLPLLLSILSFACIAAGTKLFAADENLAGTAPEAAGTRSSMSRDEKMAWWRDAKFGMFIHYGLYSGLAGEWRGVPMGSEWIQRYAKVDTETYMSEALPLFKPKKNCVQSWAALAKKAGCRYAVLTTKHHEGFALFETEQEDGYFSAAQVGRDLVKEYVTAFRKEGIRIGFYHSLLDWHQKNYDWTINPDLAYPEGQATMLTQKFIPRNQEAYKRYLAAQVRELLSNYGQVDVIWWDYSQDRASGDLAWGASDLIKLCRELQPGIIMNNRLFSYSGLDSSAVIENFDTKYGDFVTPERHIPASGYPGTDWESCMTVGDKWGYNRYDKNIKSPETVIYKLQECVAKGGNLLLNINPRADGSVPAAVEKVFVKIGEWLDVNGNAIYGTQAFFGLTDAAGTPVWATRQKDGRVYAFLPEGASLENFALNYNGVPATFHLLAETVCPVLVVELPQ